MKKKLKWNKKLSESLRHPPVYNKQLSYYTQVETWQFRECLGSFKLLLFWQVQIYFYLLPMEKIQDMEKSEGMCIEIENYTDWIKFYWSFINKWNLN